MPDRILQTRDIIMLLRHLATFLIVSVISSITVCGPSLLFAQEADEKKDPKSEGDSRAQLVTGALKFRNVGPAFMSGRIGDVAIDPVEPNT